MKTFKQFLEQIQLPSNYTDYKAPAVQAAHARGMQDASRMRRMSGINATAIDPENTARGNVSGSQNVAKPLPGTTIPHGPGKGFKVGGGSSGVEIRQEQWYANPTSQTNNPDGSTTTTFTTPDGKKQTVHQTAKEKKKAGELNQENTPTNGSLW